MYRAISETQRRFGASYEATESLRHDINPGGPRGLLPGPSRASLRRARASEKLWTAGVLNSSNRKQVGVRVGTRRRQ